MRDVADFLLQIIQSHTQSLVPLGRGTKGSGIIHCLLSFDWSSYCFEVTNQNKTLFYFLYNFRTKSDPEAMNTPRKIARQRSSVGIKCRLQSGLPDHCIFEAKSSTMLYVFLCTWLLFSLFT